MQDMSSFKKLYYLAYFLNMKLHLRSLPVWYRNISNRNTLLTNKELFYIKKIWKVFKEKKYILVHETHLYYFSYINGSIFMFTFWFILIIYLMSQLAMHKWPLDVSKIVFNFVLFWNPNFYFWTYNEVLMILSIYVNNNVYNITIGPRSTWKFSFDS